MIIANLPSTDGSDCGRSAIVPNPPAATISEPDKEAEAVFGALVEARAL
jgi:hypothetical protein